MLKALLAKVKGERPLKRHNVMLTWVADGKTLVTVIAGHVVIAAGEGLVVAHRSGRSTYWCVKGVGQSRPGGLRLEPGARTLAVNIPGCGRVMYERCTPTQSLAAQDGTALPALLREWFEGRPGVRPVGHSLIVPVE